jgi:hypothetical protein
MHDRDIPPLVVALDLVNTETRERERFTATIHPDNTGVYRTEGTLLLSGLLPNRPYAITVKGPKHLARQMEQRVTLQEGFASGQLFNWTVKPLQPGDLPIISDGGKQDGVINAKDISLVLGLFGKEDAASVTQADLNYDGIVNLTDFALLIGTVKVTNRDESL